MRRDSINSKSGEKHAEAIAASILGWLAADAEMLGRFLSLSGLQPHQLRGAVEDRGFMAGMIDFLMQHEPTLLAFCEVTGTRPEAVAAASQHFSPAEY